MEKIKALWAKVSDFFVDLYDKFIHLSWVEWVIDYCKREPMMAGIIAGAALLVLVVFILICHGGKKKRAKRKAKKEAKKLAKAQKKSAKKAKKHPAPTPVAEDKPVEIKAEPVAEPIAAKTPVAVAEVVEEPEAVDEPVIEEKPVEIKAEPVVEEKPVEVKVEVVEEVAPAVAPAEVKTDMAQTLDLVENIDENTSEELLTHYEEDETDSLAKYTGKWVICRLLTDTEDHEEMYFFELHASNGEKLLASEEYTTYAGALRGIQTHKSNILKRNFKLTTSKKGDFIFKLLSGKNMLLCMGENYPTKARCESALESTVRFAETAVVDENVQDIVIKVPKEEDGAPVAPPPENAKGKWIISSKAGADGETLYYFELYANNGEKLLSSEDYTTYIGVVNGIETHKKNVEQDNFRISLTKRGDYIYKLLNGNGQLLCLGEHYKTKRLCQNAVESVKRFALHSPMLKQE